MGELASDFVLYGDNFLKFIPFTSSNPCYIFLVSKQGRGSCYGGLVPRLRYAYPCETAMFSQTGLEFFRESLP